MVRAVVNVATDSWVGGQNRLCGILNSQGEQSVIWTNQLPPGSPPHRARGVTAGNPGACVPYAFKAYALKAAVEHGAETLLWADACIVPAKPLGALWEQIERDGYWMSQQGYTNDQWTADSAYKDLFREYDWVHGYGTEPLAVARVVNSKIPHVVATTFGICVSHPTGRAFLDEYFRLASTTKAFCGPWQNANSPSVKGRNTDRDTYQCGPPETMGHRHDQTAASVIAWRLGMKLTDPPAYFSYKGGETEETFLIADGAY